MSRKGFWINDNSVKLQDFENIQEIKVLENELEKVRMAQVNSIVKAVTEIRNHLEALKKIVYNNSFKFSNSTVILRNKMIDLEEKIIRVKETIRLRMLLLLKDENSLRNELDVLRLKMEDWSKPERSKTNKLLRKSSCKFPKIENKNPMTEFQSFLIAFGGHYGGWEEHDHLVFLKERKKFKTKSKFISAVQNSLQDLSYEEVVDHEKWYIQYEILKKAQKTYIQQWKSEKIKEQSEKLKSPKKDQQCNLNLKTNNHKNITERIKKWKEQQQLKKLEEEERQKNEKLLLIEEEKKNKEVQKAKKLAIQKYKNEKLKKMEEKILLQKANQIQLMDSKLSNALWKSFRLQDIKFIEKRKLIQNQLKEKISNKLDRSKSAKSVTELRRDPERVMQPTFVWALRCQQINKRQKIDPVFNLHAIQRLAVPEWRKELRCL